MDADAATQPAPELPPAARPGPEIVEDHVLLRHDQPIDIGKGEMVPLGALLACRRKRCRHCEDGWLHRPQPDGSRRAAVCGCCAEGWRAARFREAAAAVATSPAIVRAALAGAEVQAYAHQDARLLALAMQGDAEREIERRRGGLNLERLDREIAKARRRLVGARIYGGVADAAPATEGA